MVAYFVTHPYIDRTAVVYAPSTEKARTTFLDWLERNGLISRRSRQAYRRDMVAERLEDPGVPADVVLHYRYGEEPQPEVIRLGEEMVEVPVERREEDYGAYEEPAGPYEEPGGWGPETEEEPEPKRMPIQEVMLRGFE